MQVFISHAVQDNELARIIAARLVEAGVHVWSPDDQIYPGDNWAAKIGEALEQSEIMIAIVTRESLQSGSLINDIQFALTSRNFGGRVIPVLVDYVAVQPGLDIPWILLRLDPVFVNSSSPRLDELVQRVKSSAEAVLHATR